MWRSVSVVARKEVVDNLRDRRSLMAALVSPMLGPLFIVASLALLSQVERERREAPLTLPVQGAEHAPELMSFLGRLNLVVEDAPADAERYVRQGEADVVLIVSEAYGEALRQGRPAPLSLLVAAQRQESSTSLGRVRRAILAYSTTIGRLRLQARGIDSRIAEPIALRIQDVSSPEASAGLILGFALTFVLLSAFIGGAYLTVDTTAGERERGSLEPLLANPTTRGALVLGKWLAALVFTAATVVETVVLLTVAINGFPTERYLGTRLSLSWGASLELIGIMVPVMPLAVSAQMFAASYTKSFKEAQNYVTALAFIPALPAVMASFVPVQHRLWIMLLPTFSQQLLMKQVVRAEELAVAEVLVASAASISLALGILWLIVRRYRTEAILFR